MGPRADPGALKARGSFRLPVPTLRHPATVIPVPAQDDVIHQGHAEGLSGLPEAPGEPQVFDAGGGVARRVVVPGHGAHGPEAQGLPEEFPGGDEGGGGRALAEDPLGQELVAGVEGQEAEPLFVGALVDVQGVSAPGGFGPVVSNQQIAFSAALLSPRTRNVSISPCSRPAN